MIESKVIESDEEVVEKPKKKQKKSKLACFEWQRALQSFIN